MIFLYTAWWSLHIHANYYEHLMRKMLSLRSHGYLFVCLCFDSHVNFPNRWPMLDQTRLCYTFIFDCVIFNIKMSMTHLWVTTRPNKLPLTFLSLTQDTEDRSLTEFFTCTDNFCNLTNFSIQSGLYVHLFFSLTSETDLWTKPYLHRCIRTNCSVQFGCYLCPFFFFKFLWLNIL